MTYNYYSKNAGIYRWFYTTSQMPNNLCIYFWKTVFMYIAMPAYLVIILPIAILKLFNLYDGNRFGAALSVWLFLIAIVLLVTPIVTLIMGLEIVNGTILYGLFSIGVLAWMCVVIVTAIASIVWTVGKIQDRRTSFMAVDYVKSVKNKYCPIITWKNRDKDV